jgi:hypothetical protein
MRNASNVNQVDWQLAGQPFYIAVSQSGDKDLYGQGQEQAQMAA